MKDTQEQDRRKTLIQRLVYGSSAVFLMVSLFVVDARLARWGDHSGGWWGDLARHGSVVPVAWALLAWGAARELTRLFQTVGAQPYVRLAAVASVVLALTPWLSAAGLLGSRPAQVEGYYWPIAFWPLFVMCLCLATLLRHDPRHSLRDVSATAWVVLLVGFLPSFGLQLRCARDIGPEQGAWLLLIVLMVIKAGDIGAYFVGSAWGRTKLVPRISPGKTVEGMIGGILASVVVALAISLTPWSTIFHLRRPGEQGGIPWWGVIVFGASMAISGQLGDLLESCFKRDAGLKDSGGIVPALGGILDVIDSPLVALPMAWILLSAMFAVV